MSFNQPKSPDPVATSNAQQQYNLSAATNQNKINSYNQDTPFGGVQYVADPSSPSGYRISTTLSAPQQTAYDTGGKLLTNSASMYSAPPDLNSSTGAVASKLNQWNAQYLQPIFNQQDSNLEARLRNQGLTPGSQAYDNAKNLQARNQGDVTTNYLTKNQGQAFNQALTEYGLPLQTAQSLFGIATPRGFQNGPTAQIQPPNYSGQVQQNYQNEMQNYQNTWNGIGKLAGAGVSLAMAPMTGGASLAGGIGSMFGSSPGGTAGVMNYGGQSWPSFG